MKNSGQYCKECIERSKISAAAASSSEPSVAGSVSVPEREPKRVFFVVGGIGCIMNAIMAAWFFLRALGIFHLPSYPAFYWIISYVLLAIGLVLASIGYFGIRHNFGSGIGLAGFGVGVVSSALFLLWTVWDYIVVFPMDHGLLLVVYFEVTVYDIFFIAMILWGVTHVITRRFTDKSGLSFATGIMLIVTGVFLEVFDVLLAVFLMWDFYGYSTRILSWTSDIFYLVWTFLFFASEIMAAILFFTTKVHMREESRI